MDEQNISQEEYTPRPRWQVWCARIAAAVMLIGFLLYCYGIAHPY